MRKGDVVMFVSDSDNPFPSSVCVGDIGIYDHSDKSGTWPYYIEVGKGVGAYYFGVDEVEKIGHL